MLPVLPRLPDVDDMLDDESYFILHAPRQSGKTTFVKFLTEKINAQGQRYALNCSLATLRGVINEDKAIDRVFSQINEAMLSSSIDAIRQRADTYALRLAAWAGIPGQKNQKNA
jgi:hypothetical protein